MVRIARPTSLAIWHRGCSHRRPNRSGSPNRRHFASLDLKKHPDVSHRRPTSQDFRRRFFWHFPASLAKKLFASLVIWGCANQIASHIAVASRDFWATKTRIRGISNLRKLGGGVKILNFQGPLKLNRDRGGHIFRI